MVFISGSKAIKFVSGFHVGIAREDISFCDLMPSISRASMIMSLTFCDGGGQPASQISQKAFISAFTFLRNGKAMWYVQFMVIRHQREEVKQAEGKRSGCEKVSGNFC